MIKTTLFLALMVISFSTSARVTHPDCMTCEISFYKLLPSPEKYEGKTIMIVGVARVYKDKLYLFPTLDSAELLSFEVSIEVSLENADIPIKFKNGDYLLTKGLFTQKYDSSYELVNGIVIDDVRIVKIEKHPF